MCSTQLDIKELKTYTYAIQGPNVAKWAKVIKKKLNQLKKKNTWELVHKSNI